MSRYRFSDFELDLDSCKLSKDGKVVNMEPQVYCLLELLVLEYGKIVSRDDIIKTVWDGRFVSNGTIDSRVGSLRSILGDDGRRQRVIKTYPNRGYRFVGTLEEIRSETLERARQTKSPTVQKQQSHSMRQSKGRNGISKSKLSLAILGLLLTAFTLFFLVNGQKFPLRAEKQNPLVEASGDDLLRQSRIAILPIQVVGSPHKGDFLPNIIDSEFRQALTAIHGISAISIAPETKLPTNISTPAMFSEVLDLDYVLTLTLTYYGTVAHIHTEFLDMSDNSVLLTRKYSIDVSESSGEEMAEWPSKSAVRTIIAVANKLEFPINERASYMTSYEFQKKVSRANDLIVTDEYDDLSQSIELLREAINEEPSYLPAYQALYHAYWRRLSFVRGDFENDAREMLNLTASMEWISPNAPETLVVKAMSSKMGVRGIAKTASGERSNRSWEDLINEAIERDPNNRIARTMRAYLVDGVQRDFEETVSVHEDALYFSPTDPTVLFNYSKVRLCKGDIEEAVKLAESNLSWNPGNRKALDSIAIIGNATADYESSLKAMNALIQKGWMQHAQTRTLRAIHFDLGDSQRALQHINFAPARAHVLAIMGETENAIKEADIIPEYYISQIATLIADPTTISNAIKYRVHPDYIDIENTAEGFSANGCSLNYLAIDAFALSVKEPDRAKILISLLSDYYAKNELQTLRTSEQYLGLISLHILQGNQERAIETLDAAIDNGFIFVDRFKEPVLAQLVSHPEFESRFDIMQSRARRLLDEFGQIPMD